MQLAQKHIVSGHLVVLKLHDMTHFTTATKLFHPSGFNNRWVAVWAAADGDWTAGIRGPHPASGSAVFFFQEKVMSAAVPAECVPCSSSPSSLALRLIRDCLVVSRRPRTWAISREKSLLCCFPAGAQTARMVKKLHHKEGAGLVENAYRFMQYKWPFSTGQQTMLQKR